MIVDQRDDMNYEKNTAIYNFMAPVFLILSFWVMIKKIIFGKDIDTNIFFIDGMSLPCRKLKENAANYLALDILYNHKFGYDKSYSGRAADFFLGMVNGQAMRNRLKMVGQCLREEIDHLIASGSEVRIFSIASGSAQGVINLLSEYKKKNITIQAQLLDLDASALENAKITAKKFNVLNQLAFINKNAREADGYIKKFNPNIIEIVGFLEYRPDDRVIALARRMRSLLGPGGVFLTSTVTPSMESYFLTHVSNWPMIYRDVEGFAKMVRQFGFDDCEIICEPLKLQKIAICRVIK